MSISHKEQFIRATGGFRLGETSEVFNAKVKEIQALEASIKAAKFKPGPDLEAAQRRLCELKGIYFDSDDEE